MSYMGIEEISKKDFEYLDWLFNIYLPKYDEIWLFGTGIYALSFTRYLQTCNVEVDGYVVSSKKFEMFENKPVLSINEFKNNRNNIRKTLLLTVHNKYYGEIYPYLMSLSKDVCFIKTAYLEFAREHCGDIDDITLSIALTEFCEGILCYGCTSAVPIVKGKNIYNFEQFCKDIEKIHRLIKDIKCINFTGGDVFLHPQLIQIVEYTRNLYKDAVINFSINGVALTKQPEDFWNEIGKFNIILNWTLYPINYPELEKTMNLFIKNNIKLNINGDGSGEDKNSWKIPYSYNKQHRYDWLFCRHHKCNKNVLMMYENTLGVCHPHRELIHLERKFGENFTSEFKAAINRFNNEIIKIDEIYDKNEIIKYMKERPSMCDYCALRERKNMGKWLASKGQFDEWFVVGE